MRRRSAIHSLTFCRKLTDSRLSELDSTEVNSEIDKIEFEHVSFNLQIMIVDMTRSKITFLLRVPCGNLPPSLEHKQLMLVLVPRKVGSLTCKGFGHYEHQLKRIRFFCTKIIAINVKKFFYNEWIFMYIFSCKAGFSACLHYMQVFFPL